MKNKALLLGLGALAAVGLFVAMSGDDEQRELMSPMFPSWYLMYSLGGVSRRLSGDEAADRMLLTDGMRRLGFSDPMPLDQVCRLYQERAGQNRLVPIPAGSEAFNAAVNNMRAYWSDRCRQALSG